MKNIILTLTIGCLCALISYGEQEKPLLVSGIYQEGQHYTEPRPSRSEYLTTVNGGFQVMKSKNGANYVLLIKRIKDLDKAIFVRVEFENPLDPNKPFREEGTISPGQEVFPVVTSEFVKGLKIGLIKSYVVTLRVYHPSDKTNPIDTLTQKIRSYIDTTGDEVLFRNTLRQPSPNDQKKD